jgi:hypothetical protein
MAYRFKIITGNINDAEDKARFEDEISSYYDDLQAVEWVQSQRKNKVVLTAILKSWVEK